MTRPEIPIKLMMYDAAWGLPSSSPFCIKLDAWLRLSGLSFVPVYVNHPKAAPKQKVPWIEHEGTRMGDSTLIIDHLSEKYTIDLDRGLSPAEKQRAWSLQTMLEEHYYQVLAYTHFVTDRGWKGQSEGLAGLPAPLRAMVGAFIRRGVRKLIWKFGMGRHSHEEIIEFGKRDMRTLAGQLADKPYFFGDQPSTFDACAFGFLSHTLLSSVESDLRTYVERDLGELVAYSRRFYDRFYVDNGDGPRRPAALAA